jgi:hypothetical protein
VPVPVESPTTDSDRNRWRSSRKTDDSNSVPIELTN